MKSGWGVVTWSQPWPFRQATTMCCHPTGDPTHLPLPHTFCWCRTYAQVCGDYHFCAVWCNQKCTIGFNGLIINLRAFHYTNRCQVVISYISNKIGVASIEGVVGCTWLHQAELLLYNLHLRKVSLFGQIAVVNCRWLVWLENQGVAGAF